VPAGGAGLQIVGDELDRLHPFGGAPGDVAAAPDEPVELAPQPRRDALEEAHCDLAALARRQPDPPAVGHPQVDPAEELMRIAREAHDQPESPDLVSTAVADYDWLVRSVSRLEYFSDTAPPGLLQTAEYAREILKMWDPAASKERIERTLAARMARQQRFAGADALEVRVIVGEGALRCVVGGPEVMRAQLRHLLDCTEDAEPFAQALRRIKRMALSQRESVAMIAALTKAMTRSEAMA
jgi:hypothetical protein